MKHPLLAALLFVCTNINLMSCSDHDGGANNKPTPYSGIPLIILDTDIGSSTDDLLAMEMLYRYMDKGRCNLLGVMVNREGEEYAALADLMNTFFGHGNIPIGIGRDGVKKPNVYIDYKMLPYHTGNDGLPMFRRSLTDYSALPDSWQLYRQLLAQQPDHSVSIISLGFVTSLAHLLQSEPDGFSELNGVELVRRKVKCLYIMGGAFGESIEPIEYNFLQSVDFAQDLFDLWPADVDIIMSPGEVGDGIDYKPQMVIDDIDWTDVHPIKQVYMNYDCDTGQKMWDPLTVIQAIEGDSLFAMSERGTVTVTDEAETFFNPSPTGYCRYQLPGTEQWNEEMLERIRNVNKQQ